VPLVQEMVNAKSVLDVGCGIGTWLKAFAETGVADYTGVDGEYVNKKLIQIPMENFVSHNLNTSLNLKRKFDLVVSLEVAEHLETQHNNQLIEMLTLHGDVILFSAAIPGQGGQFHINEQWLSVWISLFEKYGFGYYDCIRPRIWNNSNVDVWYKQNIVIFCKLGHRLEQVFKQKTSPYKDIVHPELFTFYVNQAERAGLFEQGKLGVSIALKSLGRALRKKLS
jgi:SAM-dependent methyltransferase